MDIEELQAKLLGGLLSSDEVLYKKRMGQVLRKLSDEYFSDLNKNVFVVMKRYYRLTMCRISKQEFMDALRAHKISEARILQYDVLLDDLYESDILSDSQFLFIQQLLIETTCVYKFGQALVESADVLENGKKYGKIIRKGYSDAKDKLYELVADIDRLNKEYAPEGDVNKEASEMRQELVDAKLILDKGIRTRIEVIDNLTGGLRNGELILIAGFTGDCKTTLCINIAEDVVYTQKKNVIYATGETLRTQVRRKLISVRSRDSKYGQSSGLVYESIKKGKLTESEEGIYNDIVGDMCSGDYGKLIVFQFPHKATLDYIKSQLTRYQAEFHIDLVIIDELRLLGSSRKRVQKWEEFDELLVGLKQMAVTHNNGSGVPIITPYQIRREDWKQAIGERKPYTKTCLANSSEAERSADLIWTLLRIPESAGGNLRELRCSVLKYRDGEEIHEFFLDAELSTCYISSPQEDSYEDL